MTKWFDPRAAGGPAIPNQFQMAAKGDIIQNDDGSYWESYGSAGTRKGGKPGNPADDEGDLDAEGYRKEQNIDLQRRLDNYNKGIKDPRDNKENSMGKDQPDPNDAKGWRREFFIRKRKDFYGV